MYKESVKNFKLNHNNYVVQHTSVRKTIIANLIEFIGNNLNLNKKYQSGEFIDEEVIL